MKLAGRMYTARTVSANQMEEWPISRFSLGSFFSLISELSVVFSLIIIKVRLLTVQSRESLLSYFF